MAIIIFHCFLGFGQMMPLKLLKSCQNAYANLDKFSCTISVKSFNSSIDSRGEFIGSGEMKLNGKLYYSYFADNEIVTTSENTLFLDHLNKLIYYSNNDIPANEQIIPDKILDSLNYLYSEIAYLGETTNSYGISLYSIGKEIYRTDLWVDKENYLINQIEYYYSENSKEEAYDTYKVVIAYSNNLDSDVDEAFFNWQNYVRLINNQILPTLRYTDYEIIDMR